MPFTTHTLLTYTHTLTSLIPHSLSFTHLQKPFLTHALTWSLTPFFTHKLNWLFIPNSLHSPIPSHHSSLMSSHTPMPSHQSSYMHTPYSYLHRPSRFGYPHNPQFSHPPGPPGLVGGGTVYTKWGRTTCPSVPGTELVYEGIAAGSQHNQKRGGSNRLSATGAQIWCLSTRSAGL